MGAEAVAFTWLFCGDFSAEIVEPVARGLFFCGFEAFLRALEMTKRRRSVAGFTPALRRLLLRCLRATLPRAVLFLFGIYNNKTCCGSFGSENPANALRQTSRAGSVHKCPSPIKLQESAKTEDRRGFMLASFSQNSRRNHRQDKLLTL
jgi:hypothetical protein